MQLFQYLEKVKIALEMQDDDFIKKVKEIGRSNSWEARAEVIKSKVIIL